MERTRKHIKSVRTIQLQLRIMLADSRADVGHSWDLDQRRNGTELTLINQTEIGTKLLNKFCSTSQRAAIRYFVPPAPWKEENFRSKVRGKKSIHFNGSEENIELILRTVISVNQLSIYGAVADLCKELSKDSRVSRKPAANGYLETMEIPTELPIADPHTDAELQGNLQDYERKFEQLPADQKLSKLCSDAGLKIVEKGQFFITLDEEEGPNEMNNLSRVYTFPRNEEASRARGGFSQTRKSAQSWM